MVLRALAALFALGAAAFADDVWFEELFATSRRPGG
jgi:hypothetical protein